MTTPATTPIELFYSYAHTDEPLRKELEKHLSLLKRQGYLAGMTLAKPPHLLSISSWIGVICFGIGSGCLLRKSGERCCFPLCKT